MKIELKPGVRYSVTVRAAVGSPMALAMLRARLVGSGFDAISIEPLKDETKVSARYCGKQQTITIDYDVKSIEAVA